MTERMFSFRAGPRLASILAHRRDRSRFIREAVMEKLLVETGGDGGSDPGETQRLRAGVAAIARASAALLSDEAALPPPARAGLAGIHAAASELLETADYSDDADPCEGGPGHSQPAAHTSIDGSWLHRGPAASPGAPSPTTLPTPRTE